MSVSAQVLAVTDSVWVESVRESEEGSALGSATA